MDEDFKRTDDHVAQLTSKFRHLKLWNILHNSANINDFIVEIENEIALVEERENKSRKETMAHRQRMHEKEKQERVVATIRKDLENCTREIQKLNEQKFHASIDAGQAVFIRTGLDRDLTGEESFEELEEILRQQKRKLSEQSQTNARLQRNVDYLEEHYDEMLLEDDTFENKENARENSDAGENSKSSRSNSKDFTPLDHCTYRCTYAESENSISGSVLVEEETYDVRILFGAGMFGEIESIEVFFKGKLVSSLAVGPYLAFAEDPTLLFSEVRQEAASCHFWLKHCTKLQSKFQCINQTSKSLSLIFPSDLRIDITRNGDYGLCPSTPLLLQFSKDPPQSLRETFYSLLEFLDAGQKHLNELQSSI